MIQSLYHITNEVISDLYVLGIVVKYGIFCQTNPTLVVALYHCSV